MLFQAFTVHANLAFEAGQHLLATSLLHADFDPRESQIACFIECRTEQIRGIDSAPGAYRP